MLLFFLKCKRHPNDSSVDSEFLGVSSFPGSSDGWSSVVGLVSLLSETSLFLTGGGKSSKLSFVVFLRNDPVDSWANTTKESLEDLPSPFCLRPLCFLPPPVRNKEVS